MDFSFVIRVILTLAVAGFLFSQSRQLAGQPNRKRAFQLGAAALLCFAAFNLSVGVGAEFGALQQAMAFVGMALFVAAAVSLALSMRGNERDSDRAKAVVQAQTFREELDRSRSEKPGKGE